MWYKIGFDDYSQNHAYVQQIYKLTNHANSQSHNRNTNFQAGL